MLKRIVILIGMVFLFIMSGFSLFEKNVNATVISSTSLKDDLPYLIFEGKSWTSEPDTKYTRLDILLDTPVKLGMLEIEFENTVKESVTIYLNDLDQTYYMVPKNNIITLAIDYKNDVNSVKFNFGENKGVIVKKITLLDENIKEINVHTSKAVEGTAKASSTLEPSRFYDIEKLFDSKLENGWSSDKKKSGDVLEFKFEGPQTIRSLKIWNGYQRSEVHFKANSRVRTAKLEDGKGYLQTVTFKDSMGAQEIKLPQKFTGDYLKMTIVDSYTGSVYKDLVISELRFFDGKYYFFINPVKFLKNNIDYNRAQFSAAGVQSILDSEAGYSTGPDGYLRFRLRSDGSVYCEGSIADESKAKRYFIIGNYEILKSTEEGVNLRLFGYMVTEEGKGTWQDGDCGGGGYSYEYKDARKKIFTEFISIKKADEENRYLFINTGDKHNLNFEEAKFYLNEN
jgi:hypothetical protein